MKLWTRLSKIMVLAVGLAAVSAFGSLPGPRPASPAAPPVITPIDLGSEIAGFYRDRDFAPLWVAGRSLRPEAHALLGAIGPLRDRQLDGAIRAAASSNIRRAGFISGARPGSI